MQAWEERVMDRQEGFEEGLGKGRSEGLNKGLSQGLSKGREEGFEAFSTLVRDGILSLDQAAERLKDRKDDFLKWYELQKER